MSSDFHHHYLNTTPCQIQCQGQADRPSTNDEYGSLYIVWQETFSYLIVSRSVQHIHWECFVGSPLAEGGIV